MRHLNDNRAYPPQRRNFSEDWGLDGINVPFFDMPSSRGAVYPPPCPFWALQVLPQWHQRCRWGCGPVGSLAELSPGEVELFVLLSNSVQCLAEAARRQLDQFERSRLFCVPRLANKVAMFGQFVHRPCFFLECEGPWSRLFLWQHLATLKGQKCEIDSCKWSDLQKSFARGAATDCRPFIDSPDKMAYVCHSLTWHVANMGLVYPHRPLFDDSRCFGFGTSADGAADLLEVLRQSPLTFVFALKFRPVRGSEFPMAHGPRCVMQTASPRRSCTASVAATSRGCFRCRGWMRRLRCR